MFLLAFPLALLAIFGLGATLSRRLGIGAQPVEEGGLHDLLEELWIGGVLGLLVLGLLVTALGFARLLSPVALWILTLGSIGVSHRALRELCRFARWREVGAALGSLGLLWKLSLGASVLLLLGYGLLALVPATQHDTLAHHYVQADMFLRWGGIYELKQIQQSYFPSHLQLLFAYGMAIGGEPTANLLAWFWSSWVILGCLVIGRNLWSVEAGIGAALVMATNELYGKQLMGGWADSGVTCFALLGAYGPLRFKHTAHAGWLWVGALAMGGALAASKLNALIPYGLVVIGLAWWWLRERQSQSETPLTLPQLVGYAGIALLPPLVWWGRAYLLTANPVYPLTLWGLFPGPELPVYVESSWVDQSFVKEPFNFLRWPWILTFTRVLPDGFQGRFPPQWLLAVPLAALWRGHSWQVRWWLWLVVATLVVMLKIAPKETRYMMFMMPWMALLSGLAIDLALQRVRNLPAQLCLGLAILVVPLGLRNAWVAGEFQQKWPVITKQTSRAKYVQTSSPITGTIAIMNALLPPDAFVFCLEDRTYRLDRDWTNYYAATEKYPQTAEESYTFCFRQGVTHLFLGDGTAMIPTVLRNIVAIPPDDQGRVRFTLPQVMFNLLGEPIDPKKHWVAYVTARRFLQRGGFETTLNPDGIEVFSTDHARLLSSPINAAQVNVINAIAEMHRRGFIQMIDSESLRRDTLNMVFAFDYEAVGIYEDRRKFGVGRPGWTYLHKARTPEPIPVN